MLGVFSSTVVLPPDELVAAGSRTPLPKMMAMELVDHFTRGFATAVLVQIGDQGYLAYTHENQSSLKPRSFVVKDEIFCLFEGALDNLGSLRQQYGLSKTVNQVVLIIEAYKALRDRAPYPPSHVVGHLIGDFAFVLFDRSTSAIFVVSAVWHPNVTNSKCNELLERDQQGKVPLFWGITADGFLAFADIVELLRGTCGKSLASFPQSDYPQVFFSTTLGGLRSYEHPKNKVTAIPATEEEIWGATFQVERVIVLAGRE